MNKSISGGKKPKYGQIIPLQPDNEWQRNLYEAKMFIFKDGRMGISRRKNGKTILIPVSGIDAAHRMQEHILDNYLNGSRQQKGEIDQIKSLEDIIWRINIFLRNWPEVKKRGHRKEIRELTASVILALEQCQNFFKVNALGQIEEVYFIEDGCQRENPGAMAARTIASLNNLGQRLLEVKAIIPIISIRKQILELEIKRLEIRVCQALNKLKLINRIKPSQKSFNFCLKRIRELISEADEALNTIWVNPYLENKSKARENLRTAKKILTEGDPQWRNFLGTAENLLHSTLASKRRC